MKAGQGINTIEVNGEIKHITDLDALALQAEWTKLKNEVNELYQINEKANSGLRGIVLRLLGISLPVKKSGISKNYSVIVERLLCLGGIVSFLALIPIGISDLHGGEHTGLKAVIAILSMCMFLCILEWPRKR